MFKKCSKILYSISLVSLLKKPALLLHSNDFKTRHKVLTGSIFFHSHSSSVTCYYITLTSYTSRPNGGLRRLQLRDVMWNCDTLTCHSVVYPTYHDQKSVSSINLTFRKNIIKEKKLQINYVTINKSFIKFLGINFV